MKILDILRDRHKLGKKSIAVLIDPDKVEGQARTRAPNQPGERELH